MKDDKIEESNFSIVKSTNQNELSSLKPRKNSEIYTMLPKSEDDISTLNKTIKISYNTENLLKFRLKEQLKNIFTLGKLGNTFTLWPDDNGNPKIFIGPNILYYILMNIIFSTIFFSYMYLFYNILSNYEILIGLITYFFWVLSFLILFLINPGYPKITTESLRGNKDMKYCDKCEIWYNPEKNVEHCDICDICIEEFDHHCSWAGKCIGKGDKCFFRLFVIFTLFLVFYLIFSFWIINNKYK